MATYSSVLAWRIPGTGEPGGLPSLGSHPGVEQWLGGGKLLKIAENHNRNCVKVGFNIWQN